MPSKSIPETLANAPGALAEDTSEKTGQSRRVIEENIQIARDISPEVIMEVLVVRCMEDGKEGAKCCFELDESERMNRFIQEFLVNGRVGMEISVLEKEARDRIAANQFGSSAVEIFPPPGEKIETNSIHVMFMRRGLYARKRDRGVFL